jgi:hypothetical protein
MGDGPNENIVLHSGQAMKFPGFTIAKGAAGVTRVTLATGIPNAVFFLWISDTGVRPDPTVPGVNTLLHFADQSADALGFLLFVGVNNQVAMVVTDTNGFVSADVTVFGGPGNNPLDFWVAATPATGLFPSRKLTNADFG